MRTWARIVATAGLLSSLVCVAILHVVRPEISPVSYRLSEYAIGPHGWLMTTAFVSLGIGLATLGVALLAQRPRGIAWIVPSAALVAGIGMILSAVFRTGVSDTSEVIHSRASIAATVAVVGLAVVRSTPVARRWSDGPRDRVGTGLALAAVVLAVLGPVLHDTRWTGLGQRLLWIVLLTWLVRALWTRPLAGPTGRGPTSPGSTV